MRTLVLDPPTAGLDEVLERRRWLALVNGEYRPLERSGLIELGVRELAERLDWPPGA